MNNQLQQGYPAQQQQVYAIHQQGNAQQIQPGYIRAPNLAQQGYHQAGPVPQHLGYRAPAPHQQGYQVFVAQQGYPAAEPHPQQEVLVTHPPPQGSRPPAPQPGYGAPAVPQPQHGHFSAQAPHQPEYRGPAPQQVRAAPVEHGGDAALPGAVTGESSEGQQGQVSNISGTEPVNDGDKDHANTDSSQSAASAVPAPPRNYPPPPPPAHRPPEMFDPRGCIGEHEVRAALMAHDRKNSGCLGSGPAKDMILTSFTISNALRYQLETFTEARATGDRYAPYQGGDIDCRRGINDHPPDHATMACQPDEFFKTHSKDIRIPRTSEIQTCHHCSSGQSKCTLCSGKGVASCKKCRGNGTVSTRVEGKRQKVTCGVCGGSKRSTCGRCKGEGKVNCGSCRGGGKLVRYRVVTVIYTNHVSEFVYERSDLPDNLVKGVTGQLVLQQTLPLVWPITQYQVPEINQNSSRIVSEHRTAWPDSRILQQRQTLRSLPITEAHYTFRNAQSRFWVYGFERVVYAPDYPKPTCDCCIV